MWSLAERSHWRVLWPAYDEQRRALGLTRSGIRAVRRIVESARWRFKPMPKCSGLEEEWGLKRPLVGTVTLQSATDLDDAVDS